MNEDTCNWCQRRPAVVIYRHSDETSDGVAYGTLNGPRCPECTPKNEYVSRDWRRQLPPEMRPVRPSQKRSLYRASA